MLMLRCCVKRIARSRKERLKMRHGSLHLHWVFLASVALAVLSTRSMPAQQILVVSPALPTTADQVTFFLSVPGCAFRVASVVQGGTISLYPDTSLPCPPIA